MSRLRSVFAIALLTSCFSRGEASDATPPDAADAADATPTQSFPRETILRNMPTNSEQRCVGISVVIEALLDGNRASRSGHATAASVAERLYRGLAGGKTPTFDPQVMIDGVPISIDSRVAIEELSSLVTDAYKQDFARLSATPRGRENLLAAEDSLVVNAKALESVLDGEPDRTDAFFGSGTRTFADGSVESTHHVFLIGKQADGKKYVYDPNDPGSPIPCRITDRAGGVEVQWVCRYRDTGNVTTQRYRIVQKDTFFRRMLDD